MASSGSTPSPSARRPPRLLLRVVGDDDPKACTGLRLIHLGRAHRVPESGRLDPPPVVLDPYARRPLSPADAPVARRGGILAVDCSWNRLAEAGRFPGGAGPTRPSRSARRLPFLLAANPQHFGRLGELNTVEALASALAVLDFHEAAARLLEGFRGGPALLELNAAALARYVRASSAEEVEAAERAIYGGVETPTAGETGTGRAPRGPTSVGRSARR